MGRFAVLSARPELAIYRELEAAGERAGHRVDVVDAVRAVAKAHPAALWSERDRWTAEQYDAVLARVGAWRPDSTLALLEALESAGVAALNTAAAVRVGRDHWLSALALAEARLPHPETIAGAEPAALASAASACGFPCVVKQRSSRQGVGVIRCGGRAELEAVLDSLWRVGAEAVVQRFCAPGGVSRRVLVLIDKVLGATEHVAAPGEFRANAARGAAVRAVEISAEHAALAVAAARALRLGFAGIDLLPDGDRWVVGEVNPSPGWHHFQGATGVDVARALITALASLGSVR